jgi:hypothetical protein
MFCESKELKQAKTGSQIEKQIFICSSHVSENVYSYCLYNEGSQQMASVTPAVTGTANMNLYQPTVKTETDASLKPLTSDECI